MEEAYTPISCSFYDRLEAAATLKKEVDLQIINQDKLESIKTKILTIKIRDKVEYLVLENNLEVRLDKIHALDGIELNNHC